MQPVEQALTTQAWGDPWQVLASAAEHRHLEVVTRSQLARGLLSIDIDHRELQAQSPEIELPQAGLQPLTQTTASAAVKRQFAAWLISHGLIGDRIASTWGERVATQQSLDREPAAAPGTMPLNRFKPIGTAGWNKPTTWTHQWRNKAAIKANQGQQQLGQTTVDDSGSPGEKAYGYSG